MLFLIQIMRETRVNKGHLLLAGVSLFSSYVHCPEIDSIQMKIIIYFSSATVGHFFCLHVVKTQTAFT